MEKAIEDRLKSLTGKSRNYLVARGNKAILCALKQAVLMHRKNLILPDQGGWITYKQYAKKLKMNTIVMNTEYGVVLPNLLETILSQNPESALLLTAIAGYYAEQPIDDIIKLCKKHDCLFINDITAAIGIRRLCKGDILVASIGKDKPLNLGKGGIVSLDTPLMEKAEELELTEEENKILLEKIDNLDKRWAYLNNLTKGVKDSLSKYDVLHKEKFGINVIIRFRSDKERDEILDICKKAGFECRLCPMNIKVECPAVSVEIQKR